MKRGMLVRTLAWLTQWLKRTPKAMKRALGSVAVVTLLAAFGVVFALAHAAPPSNPASASAADTSTPTASVTATGALPTVTASAVPSPATETPTASAPGGAAPFMVTGAVANTWGMTGTLPGGCPDPTFPVIVNGTIFTTNGEGAVTYRWLFSAGAPSAPITADMSYIPRGNHGNFVEATWNFPAAAADPSVEQWIQLEVLAPNHLLGPRVDFARLTCTFGVVGIGQQTTYTPTSYNCDGPDAQTFTISASLNTLYSPGATLTYHWERPDGTRSPDLTARVAPGVDTVTLAPETLTITHAMMLEHPQTGPIDRLVLTAPVTSADGVQLLIGICLR